MPKSVQMIITMDEQQNIEINGPVNNLLVCLGMLELAKITLQRHHHKSQEVIQPATLEDVPTHFGGLKS